MALVIKYVVKDKIILNENELVSELINFKLSDS